MNQNQNSSIQQKQTDHETKKTFHQTIKRIEFNAFKQQIQKKKQICLRNKLRDQWLERIKIIPPRLSSADRQSFFRATDSFLNRDNYSLKIFRHDYVRSSPFNDGIDQLFHKDSFQVPVLISQPQRESLCERKSQKNMASALIKTRFDAIRARKVKQNWKLAYRKDEINIMRFSTSSPKQQKCTQFPRFLSSINENELKMQPQAKVLYKKIVQLQEQNKENKQNGAEQNGGKKQQKQFRLNMKRGKTSLIVKRPLLL